MGKFNAAILLLWNRGGYRLGFSCDAGFTKLVRHLVLAIMTFASINLAQEADFGILDLNISPQTCCVEAKDVTVRVEPKVMEVLVLLARAGGDNVTRDQLISACWEGRVVSEDAITRILSKARKIGTLTNPPAFHIESRAKIGVRLVQSDQILDAYPTKILQRKPADTPLLIVFPFENLSSDPDMQFFSDGVSEEVLSRIIRGSKLKVIGPTSSFKFRGPNKAGAAEALNATHVVDGSVRRAGNKVRISAHLTEVATGAGLWAETFERDLVDIFALQDEIADGIARALFAKFTPAKLTPIDPAIYDLYLRAKDMETITERQLKSIASLERVTQTAPVFADGWGRLATLRALMRMNLPHSERGPITAQLRNDIARCYAIDPTNREANYADFWLTPSFGAFLEQERFVQKALSQPNPSSDDLACAAFHFCNVGRLKQSFEFVDRARSLDPSSWAVMLTNAIALWGNGNTGAASDAFREVTQKWPQDQQATAVLLLLACWRGDWAEIDRLTDPKRLAQFPLREHSGILATSVVMRHPTPENKHFLFEMMKARAQKMGAIDAVPFTFSSMIGMANEAYDAFARLPFGPSGSKTDHLGMMGHRTLLLFMPPNEAGRADPRFVQLCARVGLVEYWLKTGLWPDCVDEVPYDFKAACSAARDVPTDRFKF
jgi:TolB-like protein